MITNYQFYIMNILQASNAKITYIILSILLSNDYKKSLILSPLGMYSIYMPKNPSFLISSLILVSNHDFY